MEKIPNVLLILPDQMRGDCYGAAGHPVVRTPNIDKLADDGVSFRNAFSQSPICVPARSHIMTGRWGHETGNRWDNRSWRYRTDSPVEADGVMVDACTRTLPDLLMHAGSFTSSIGKCHFYPRLNPLGFVHRISGQSSGENMASDDEYFRYLRDLGMQEMHLDSFGKLAQIDPNLKRDGSRFVYRVEPYVSRIPAEHQFTRWCGDRTIDLLSRAGPERPFFLQVGFHAPHDPFCVSNPYNEMYDWRNMELPPRPDQPMPDFPSWAHKSEVYGRFSPENDLPDDMKKKNWAYYLANISFIDEQVGRMVKHLKDTGAYENTIIIFTSDHGDHMGQHWLYGKSTFYDEAIRVPMIISGGPVTRCGVTDAFATLMDIFPSVLNMCGLPVPDDLRDVVTLNHLAEGEQSDREFVFGELGENETAQYMVRSRTHKYIRHPVQNAEEFFDLESDPLEMTNLASRCPEEMKRLSAVLDDWLETSRNRFYQSDFLPDNRP